MSRRWSPRAPASTVSVLIGLVVLSMISTVPLSGATAAAADHDDAGGAWSGLPHRHPDTSGVSVVDADLASDRVAPGETATVGALVENERESNATFRADLYVDHEGVDHQYVTVPAGESIVVTFDRRFDERGSYAVHVNEVPAGTVTVADPTPTATASQPPGDSGSPPGETTSTESPLPEESGLGHLPILVGVVVVLALAIYVSLRWSDPGE